jgi:hypothetical protein
LKQVEVYTTALAALQEKFKAAVNEINKGNEVLFCLSLSLSLSLSLDRSLSLGCSLDNLLLDFTKITK